MAPTVVKTKKLKVKVHANDHFPAHCHVELKDGREAVFEFDESGSFTVLKHAKSLKEKDIKALKELCEANREDIMEEWEALHGKESDDK